VSNAERPILVSRPLHDRVSSLVRELPRHIETTDHHNHIRFAEEPGRSIELECNSDGSVVTIRDHQWDDGKYSVTAEVKTTLPKALDHLSVAGGPS